MAKVLPAGSTSTRGFPPTLSGSTTIVSGTSWTVVHEVDFEAEGAATEWEPTVDGDNTVINGVKWTCKDPDNADEIGMDATGLFIEPNTTNNWWGADTFDCPRFYSELTNGASPIYSSAGDGQIIAFQAVIESSQDVAANHDGYGIIVVDGSRPATDGPSMFLRRFYNDNTFQDLKLWYSSGYTATSAGGIAQHTFFEAVFMGSNVYFASGPYTTYADPMTRIDARFQGNPNTVSSVAPGGWGIDTANLMFLFAAFRASDGGSPPYGTAGLNPRMKRMRVLTAGETGSVL